MKLDELKEACKQDECVVFNCTSFKCDLNTNKIARVCPILVNKFGLQKVKFNGNEIVPAVQTEKNPEQTEQALQENEVRRIALHNDTILTWDNTEE